jgi:hypothetical protein
MDKLHNATTKSNFIMKRLLAEELLKFVESKKDDKNISKKSFSVDYAIYSTDSLPDSKNKEYEYIGIPSFNAITYTVKGIEGMMTLLNESIDNPTFYGAIALIKTKNNEEKTPYNILSYTFIRKIADKSITINDGTKVIIYSLKKKINEDVVDSYEEQLMSLDMKDIIIEQEEGSDDKPSLLLKAPKEWEDADRGVHLSDLHVQLDTRDINTNTLLKFDIDMIRNAELTYENLKVKQMLSAGSWMVDMGCIDASGVVVPAYGFYLHKNGKMYDLICAQKHPNISFCGSNYCTGTNGKQTIKGVSELSYGNLSSPMNSSIWHEDSFSIAKAFQKVFWNMLCKTEID